MLAETTEFVAVPIAILGPIVGWLLKGQHDRRRNRRNNNPNCKPGEGERCRGHANSIKKHGESISAAQATVKALGANQAAIHQSQTETRQEIGELRREMNANFRGLHGRIDEALSRQSMPQKAP